MKNLALVIVAIISTLLSPLSHADSKSNIVTYTSYNQETFTFVERGITFSIFENGEFDFYINPRDGIHANVDLGTVSISYNSGYDYDAYVQYDDFGAIVQIEDVPIYYDYYGRISRAGDVRIRYNGQRLARVGGLYVHYNNFGRYSHFTGFVNIYNRNYVFHPYHNYFVRPIFNRCIVSYRPYRRYYNPIRYSFRDYRNNYYRGYRHGQANAQRRNRSFRSIDARIRTKPSNERRAYDRRSTAVNRSSRIASTTNSRRATQQRGVQQNTDRRNVQQRSTTLRRNNGNKMGVRRASTATRNRSTSVHQGRTTNTRSISERSKTPRRSKEASTVQRRTSTSKVGRTNSRQVRNTQSTRTQARKAPQKKRIAQNRSTSQRTVQRATSKRSTQRKSVSSKRSSSSKGRTVKRRQ